MNNRQASTVNREGASIEEIRAAFPALRRRHNGHEVAYFDGPGGTQVPEVVGRAMLDYLYHHNANTHWHYPSSEETDRLIQASREAMAYSFSSGVERMTSAGSTVGEPFGSRNVFTPTMGNRPSCLRDS